MRWLGILAILAYRVFARPFMRRRCLHEESCSTFGIRMLHAHGFIGAIPRIRHRLRSCRMPTSACFVLDHGDQIRLLSAAGHEGEAASAKALEFLALRARHLAFNSSTEGSTWEPSSSSR
jgi:putative component of membrane protein insertase Oxa1/YidC/SpoIIIJ protein YidD